MTLKAKFSEIKKFIKKKKKKKNDESKKNIIEKVNRFKITLFNLTNVRIDFEEKRFFQNILSKIFAKKMMIKFKKRL